MLCKPKSNTKRNMIKSQYLKFKQTDYVFILQPKADHPRNRIPFTDFRWIGPYINEKVLPNNNYLVLKTSTNETQIHYRMRVRQFTPANPYQTYKSPHANSNQTRNRSLNMMTYTPEHGSVKMMSQNLIAITIIWYHLAQPKSQYDLKKQLMKWGALRKPDQKIPQNFFLSQTDRMTEWTLITIRSLMRMPV